MEYHHTIGNKAPTPTIYTANYTNADMQPVTLTPVTFGTPIEVAKGTIVTIVPWSISTGVSGECTEILKSYTCGVYSVIGDCQVLLTI